MKKILSVILVLSIILSTFAGLGFHASAADLPSSGQCGENVTYTFDASTGLLTISGSGAISSSAFGHQSAVKTVVINNGVTSIGNSAFCGCNGLTNITIPNSVTSIGHNAFEACSNLTRISIPNSVTTIGDYTFRLCRGLTSITIPDSVTSIGDVAFEYCSGLTSITIPNSVTSIDDGAFRHCSSLTSINIPNSVKDIGAFAFLGCSGLANITVSSGNTIYDSRNNCNAIIHTATNTLIAGCKNTVIPNTVASISSSAFYGCSGLTSITIPDSVTSIGESAFSGCSGLTSVTIPSSVTSIGIDVFNACSGLTNVTIPNSVTSIGDLAFNVCSGLTSITIPNSVKSIGLGAFYGCSSLTGITIPSSVKSIGIEAFSSCSRLTDIQVASGNTKYDSRNNCNAIIETNTNSLIAGCKNSVIPNTVTGIGTSAFNGCSGLTGITIPDSVTSIGKLAFENCSGLTNITVSSGNTVYDSRNNCNAIIETQTNSMIVGCKNTVIPNTVTNIGGRAFVGCSSLTSISIPHSVTSIGDAAFYGCTALKSITIPSSVTSIGSSAFYTSSIIMDVYYTGSQEQWNSIAIGSSNYSFIIANIHYNYETVAPTCSISSTNNVASSQTVTLSLSDNVAIAGYYWGTNSSYSSNTYTSVSGSPTTKSITKTVSDSGTYYLTAKDSSGNVSSTQSITFYKTTLNANNGSVSPSYVITKSGSTFTLPTPTRSGYTFDGWYTEASGGSKVSSTYTVSGNTKLYARWIYHTHNYTSVVTKAATCGASGVRTYACSVCGDSYTESIPATGKHTYTSKVTKAATCGASGVRTYTCSVCDYSYTESIPATGEHTYTSKVTKAATCMASGVRTYTCSVCDYSYTESIPAPGKHTYTSKVTKAATCGASGVRTYTCSVCGDSYTETIAPTGNHSWDKGRVTVAPTCYSFGEIIYTCTVCHETEWQLMDMLAHHFVKTTKKATLKANGAVIQKCSVCGEENGKTVIYYPKTIALSGTKYTYTGKAVTPKVSVKGSNGKVINSKNYTVTYAKGRKAVGRYAVKITFKGNYSGAVTKYFDIVPKGTAFSSVSSPKAKTIAIKWKKQSGISGYQVQLATNTAFTKGVKTYNAKASSLNAKISKAIKAKTNYYLRIRTFKTVKYGGKKLVLYSGWSKVAKVKTK